MGFLENPLFWGALVLPVLICHIWLDIRHLTFARRGESPSAQSTSVTVKPNPASHFAASPYLIVKPNMDKTCAKSTQSTVQDNPLFPAPAQGPNTWQLPFSRFLDIDDVIANAGWARFFLYARVQVNQAILARKMTRKELYVDLRDTIQRARRDRNRLELAFATRARQYLKPNALDPERSYLP
ncbi:hypothetical protein B0H63DRAFT_506565 [Podospora didyma]|uniref:Uncharacterized protein n=1 Tax=Podospora didyma TaxID=330526 RepID=A0AAE0U8Y7_9PEZI|nr:hypothetical protein B0H63DRAFT_506565 [Podospora didyma]